MWMTSNRPITLQQHPVQVVVDLDHAEAFLDTPSIVVTATATQPRWRDLTESGGVGNLEFRQDDDHRAAS
jgi:hypothetical protein